MIDWGDVPTWITTLAVGFGAAQLYQERQSTRQRTERDARLQARALTSWAGSYRAPDDGGNEYGVVIRNDSGLPFREVTLTASLHGEAQEAVELRILPPGEYFVQHLKPRTWDFAVSMQEYGKPVRPYTRTTRYAVTEMLFTDAAGRRWRSLQDGRLEDAGQPAASRA
jgi:hypothetical protein